MSIRSTLTVLLVLCLPACGGSAPPADAPVADPAEGSADMPAEPVAEKPAQPAEPKAEEKQAEPAVKLDKPKSASTIGGKSISDVDGVAVQDQAKKLGWIKDAGAVGGGTLGSYEQFRFEIEKGKAKGFIEVVRPAANPTASGGSSITPPTELQSMRESEGAAVHLDPEADVIVIVSIEGKTAEAKKLLGQLVKIAKAAKK